MYRKISINTCTSQWVPKRCICFADCTLLTLSFDLSAKDEHWTRLIFRSWRWSWLWRGWRRRGTSILVSQHLISVEIEFCINEDNCRRWVISSCPGKLRDVEVMCQENEAEGGDIIRKVSNYPKNVFFSNLLFLTSPRFWIFFTRQKMVLLCLMRRMCPRLLRGRRSTSVPLKARYSRTCLSSTLLAYVWHYPSCVCYLARCTKQRLKLDSSWMCNSRM